MPQNFREGTSSSGMQVCPTCGHDETEALGAAVVRIHMHSSTGGEHEYADTKEGSLTLEVTSPALLLELNLVRADR